MNKKIERTRDEVLGYDIVKSNVLIRDARSNLSLVGQKVILFVLSKIKYDDPKLNEIEFGIGEFCDLLGIDKKSAGTYYHIKNTIQNIADASLWINLPEEDDLRTEILFRWFETVKIKPGTDKVIVRLSSELEPYLVELREQFTKYPLRNVLAMKSQYGIILYEYLKSYEFIGEHTIEIEELKKKMNAEKYKKNANFMQKVFYVAVQNINEFTELKIKYNFIKEGRKYVGVHFFIEKRTDLYELDKIYQNQRESLNF